MLFLSSADEPLLVSINTIAGSSLTAQFFASCSQTVRESIYFTFLLISKFEMIGLECYC